MFKKDKKTKKFQKKNTFFFEKILEGGKPLRIRYENYELEFLPNPKYSSREKKPDYIGNFFSIKKSVLFLLSMFFVFSVLIIQLFYLQIISGEKYRNIAEGNRTKLIITKAQRGVIFDRNKTLLVQNVPGFVVFLQPTELPKDKFEMDNYLNRLSILIDRPKEELASLLVENKDSIVPIIIKEDLKYENAIRFATQMKLFPGLNMEAIGYRKYFPTESIPYPKSLSHILGYTGLINKKEYQDLKENGYSFTDYLGKAGLEKMYETEMKGTNGVQQVEIDALGRQKKVYKNTPSIAGQDITLTIDVQLQKKVEELVLQHLKEQKRDRAAVIVLDPRNGEILAMVSVPFYDNNKFSPGISVEDYQALINDKNKPLFNRAISGTYPSGSTIKPIIGFAALDNGIINQFSKILSTGGIRVGQWFFPDWRPGGHGLVDIFDALAYSVNTFFYYIGGGYGDFSGLGVEKIVQTARRFGFGQPLGIDLPGEMGGLLPTPEWKQEVKNEPWYIGDTYHLAIGQGDLLVTPLQIAAATAVFANFGTLYQPHVVRSLEDSSGLTVPQKEYILEKITSPHIDTIRKALREVVLRGSGRRLNSLPISSAGKTGTAQWHSRKKEHAWFSAFAPYENPELVVTVLVEEGGGGEKSALPIAYDIFDWYFGVYKNNI